MIDDLILKCFAKIVDIQTDLVYKSLDMADWPSSSGSLEVGMKSLFRSIAFYAILTLVFIRASAFAQVGSIAAERTKLDGSLTAPLSGTVTFRNNDPYDKFYYIQQQGGLPGIKVRPAPDSDVTLGESYLLMGILHTTFSGERFVSSTIQQSTSGPAIEPVFMPIHSLGGGDWRFTEGSSGGQRGLTNCVGLNNIGLLVKTTGQYTYVDDSAFLLSDSSGTTVKCLYSGSPSLSPNWESVMVTGVCSLYPEGSPTIYKPQIYVVPSGLQILSLPNLVLSFVNSMTYSRPLRLLAP